MKEQKDPTSTAFVPQASEGDGGLPKPKGIQPLTSQVPVTVGRGARLIVNEKEFPPANALAGTNVAITKPCRLLYQVGPGVIFKAEADGAVDVLWKDERYSHTARDSFHFSREQSINFIRALIIAHDLSLHDLNALIDTASRP